jgi:urocanate hydratase
MGSLAVPVLEYQPRLYVTYAQLHACARDRGNYQNELSKGRLAGCFVAGFGLGEAAEVLPLAAAISGACFLGVDADGDRLKGLLRAGKCDYVVNTLDEALRILKNELRLRQPVSVVLKANTRDVVAEIEERGVAPDLIVAAANAEASSGAELRNFAPLRSALCLPEEDVPLAEEIPGSDGRAGSSEAMLVTWTLPEGTAANLARLDALALPLLPEGDGMRRRWQQAAGRYVPRQSPPSRVSAWTPREFERVVDAFSAHLMAGEVQGPVVISTPSESFTLES